MEYILINKYHAHTQAVKRGKHGRFVSYFTNDQWNKLLFGLIYTILIGMVAFMLGRIMSGCPIISPI